MKGAWLHKTTDSSDINALYKELDEIMDQYDIINDKISITLENLEELDLPEEIAHRLKEQLKMQQNLSFKISNKKEELGFLKSEAENKRWIYVVRFLPFVLATAYSLFCISVRQHSYFSIWKGVDIWRILGTLIVLSLIYIVFIICECFIYSCYFDELRTKDEKLDRKIIFVFCVISVLLLFII